MPARRERYLQTRTRLAHSPSLRTIEQFDFIFQPSIDDRQVLIVDAFGVRSSNRLSATALFSLISARYERGSISIPATLGQFPTCADTTSELVHPSHCP